MTKSTTETNSNIAAIGAQLTSLSDKRSMWEAGSYKQSNDELYDILNGCYTLLIQLRGETKLRKLLNKALEAKGFPVQSNTSLELKVVRAVFGTNGNRAYGYVRVLQVAAAEMPHSMTLAEFIEDRGGIEEIRRTPKSGITAADKAKQQRELAEKVLSDTTDVSGFVKLDDSLQPAKDSAFDFSVALIRKDKNGQGSIVFGSGKESLVKAILTEAGKVIGEREEIAATHSKHTAARKNRDDVLDKIVEPHSAEEVAA